MPLGVVEAGVLQLGEAVQQERVALHRRAPLLLRLLQICIQGLHPPPAPQPLSAYVSTTGVDA